MVVLDNRIDDVAHHQRRTQVGRVRNDLGKVGHGNALPEEIKHGPKQIRALVFGFDCARNRIATPHLVGDVLRLNVLELGRAPAVLLRLDTLLDRRVATHALLGLLLRRLAPLVLLVSTGLDFAGIQPCVVFLRLLDTDLPALN